MDTLPIYKINIDDDDTFMNAISLVDYPAVEHNFLCFKDQKPMTLQFADDEKHILTGVVCLADTPIYRLDPMRGEYYIVFTKEVIEQMAYKYSKMGLWNSVNLQHDDEAYTDDVTMVEMYIKNSALGISPSAFQDVPEGSLFCSYKVTNEELWNVIKTTDQFKGFSLEITANLERFCKKDPIDEEVDNLLK